MLKDHTSHKPRTGSCPRFDPQPILTSRKHHRLHGHILHPFFFKPLPQTPNTDKFNDQTHLISTLLECMQLQPHKDRYKYHSIDAWKQGMVGFIGTELFLLANLCWFVVKLASLTLFHVLDHMQRLGSTGFVHRARLRCSHLQSLCLCSGCAHLSTFARVHHLCWGSPPGLGFSLFALLHSRTCGWQCGRACYSLM